MTLWHLLFQCGNHKVTGETIHLQRVLTMLIIACFEINVCVHSISIKNEFL